MSRLLIALLFLFTMMAGPARAAVLIDYNYGYSVDLPAGWTVHDYPAGHAYANREGVFEVSVEFLSEEKLSDDVAYQFHDTELKKQYQVVDYTGNQTACRVGPWHCFVYKVDTMNKVMLHRVEYIIQTGSGSFIVTGYKTDLTPHGWEHARAAVRSFKLVTSGPRCFQ